MKKNCFLWTLVLCAALSRASGQSIGPSTLNVAGGSTMIGGNTYEWSVGEMAVVSTTTTSSLIVTQGLLQPVLSVNAIQAIDHSVYQLLDVYPVPTNNILYLQPRFDVGGRLQYTIVDATGKNILKKEVMLNSGKEKQSIDLNGIAAASYLMTVQFSSATLNKTATYTIQKL